MWLLLARIMQHKTEIQMHKYFIDYICICKCRIIKDAPNNTYRAQFLIILPYGDDPCQQFPLRSEMPVKPNTGWSKDCTWNSINETIWRLSMVEAKRSQKSLWRILFNYEKIVLRPAQHRCFTHRLAMWVLETWT